MISGVVVLVLLIAALVALDILALDFGADSRKRRDTPGQFWPGF